MRCACDRSQAFASSCNSAWWHTASCASSFACETSSVLRVACPPPASVVFQNNRSRNPNTHAENARTRERSRPQASTGAEPQRVLVDFYASWCGPCKTIAPKVEELAGKHAGVKVLQVDIDAQNALTQEFKITAMPTFISFRNGKVERRMEGADPKALEALFVEIAAANAPVVKYERPEFNWHAAA